ncbi:uncharacterized protein LOC144661375 isoform X1 [Oculina patagonica]
MFTLRRDLFSNAIKFLPVGVFANLTNLESLDLSSNAISFLPEEVFANLTSLYHLDLSSNTIKFLPDGVFTNLKNLVILRMPSNAITYLPHGVFVNQRKLYELRLSSNAIKFLPSGVFATLTNLDMLLLASNDIKNVTTKSFSFTEKLYSRVIQKGDIFCGVINGSFSSSSDLNHLDLSYSQIRRLPKDLFYCLNKLRYLFLQNNMIAFITNETFASSTHLQYIIMNANGLENIPHRSFFNVGRKGFIESLIIMLSDNPIRTIEAEAFRLDPYIDLMYIYLLRTKMKTINFASFDGLNKLDSQLAIKNRTVGIVKFHSGGRSGCLIYLNPINSNAGAVTVYRVALESNSALVSAIMASGFGQDKSGQASRFAQTLLPCPQGTFSNYSSKGKEGCIECLPGGFYSDDVGFVGKGCKKCPTGSYVPFDKTPGTRKQDCKSCPEGTETDFFAGYRACQCLEGFYRTHMFEKCHKCGQGGLKCQYDYASLKSGYWWEWRNKSHKDRYRYFIENLLESSPALDASSVQFPYSIPTPYRCPREESCKGGLDSPCEDGYEGPLCEVCSSGYYKQLQACQRCPSKRWMVGQLSIVAVVVLIILVLLMWTGRKKITKDGGRALTDMLLSKLKIVIGFYQVTYGLLQAFSFIKWPDSLQLIAKYSEVFQMNILQIAPVDCFFPGLHVDAFGSLFAIMAVNAAVIVFSVLAYGVCKMVISRSRRLEEVEKSEKISQTKEQVYKNLFFLLYVTYLSTCSKTANVLPLACRKLCRDEKEEMCYKYMKADYSIQCQGTKYDHLLIGAYISIAYIIALPVVSFIAIWRKQKGFQGSGYSMEIISGLRFLFENYKQRSWYWELVEISRKVVLTSGLILVGQESRSYIGLAWVIAGMYGVLFAWIKPIQNTIENRLMTISLAVTVINLGIGAVSRIPAENIPASIDPYLDAVLFKTLVLGANTLVIGLVLVQYAVFLYRYLKTWRQNPHWSFSCCLALLLPLNDFQGEMSAFVDENVLANQLQTEQIEMPTILTSVKNSGAIDVTLEEDEHRDDNEVEGQCNNYQASAYSHTTSHQETQTEICSLLTTRSMVQKLLIKSNEESLCLHSGDQMTSIQTDVLCPTDEIAETQEKDP